MAQVENPANLDRWGNPAYRLLTVILIRCGLRLSSAVSLPWDCTVTDADGAPYLRYYNTEMKREALVPIDDELRAMISAQHHRIRLRWPDGIRVLFPRPQSNLAGTRPIGGATYRGALYRWLEDCDIRDEPGHPVHLTPHQWRHTLGTVLINRDVPLLSGAQEFYLRELPPLRAVLNDLRRLGPLVVNGYADLDPAVGPAWARMRTPRPGSR